MLVLLRAYIRLESVRLETATYFVLFDRNLEYWEDFGLFLLMTSLQPRISSFSPSTSLDPLVQGRLKALRESSVFPDEACPMAVISGSDKPVLGSRDATTQTPHSEFPSERDPSDAVHQIYIQTMPTSPSIRDKKP